MFLNPGKRTGNLGPNNKSFPDYMDYQIHERGTRECTLHTAAGIKRTRTGFNCFVTAGRFNGKSTRSTKLGRVHLFTQNIVITSYGIVIS